MLFAIILIDDQLHLLIWHLQGQNSWVHNQTLPHPRSTLGNYFSCDSSTITCAGTETTKSWLKTVKN